MDRSTPRSRVWRLMLATATISVCCSVVAGSGYALAEEPAGGKASAGASPSAQAPAGRWFSVPIEIGPIELGRLVPAVGDEGMPVTVPIDFAALLAKLHVAGAVDPHSLMLSELPSGEAQHGPDVPVQFTVQPQARRAGRQLLPDTPPSVSYAMELAAGGDSYPCAGELTWMARPAADGTAKYRLRFAVPQDGRLVQVPYAPHDLRAFDAGGRAAPVRQFPTMQVRPQRPLAGRIELLADNRAVLGYHVGPGLQEQLGRGSLRRPFLHPVIGPDGVGLTEFGKPHDPTDSHAHHYSLWVAHADVDGATFWPETGGSIHHEQLARLDDGPVFCRVVQKNRWLQDKPVLLERRQTTLYYTPDGWRMFDVELELTPAENRPVKLGKTSFGFLAARVAQSLSVFDGGGEILNSEGQRNEQGAHLRHAKWLDQSGPVAPGKWNGLAIFDHPRNPRYPTGWHCRNDGWAGASFTLDEPYVIEPGTPLRLRYRIYLHRGDAQEGRVALRWSQFAAEPKVRLGDARVDETE